MVFDLKAIQAQWDTPVEDSSLDSGSGWDAPVGVSTSKVTSPGVSNLDSAKTSLSSSFLEPKNFSNSNSRENGFVAQEDRSYQSNKAHDRSNSHTRENSSFQGDRSYQSNRVIERSNSRIRENASQQEDKSYQSNRYNERSHSNSRDNGFYQEEKSRQANRVNENSLSDVRDNTLFQDDRSQQPSRFQDRSNSNFQRDVHQRSRDGSRDKDPSLGNNNTSSRREPQDFNQSSNSSDSGRNSRRYDNNGSQPRYGQGRGDYSAQPNFHQSDRRSNHGFNGGSGPRNEFNQDNRSQHFQSRDRDGSRSRASSSHQDASGYSDNIEPRGRTRNNMPAAGNLETSLDWINYPKDLDIFSVLDIFNQARNKRNILLKIKNERVARLTFDSAEFVQEALSIFKETNQPGSLIPASDSEPPKTSANSQILNHHDSDNRSENPSHIIRSSSRTSNQSAGFQRSKQIDNSRTNFREPSISRRPDPSQNNWSHTGPSESNNSEWNAPVNVSHKPQFKNFEDSSAHKFSQSSQNDNASTNNYTLTDENKATSEWDTPISAKKLSVSNEVDHSSSWETPIVNLKSNYQKSNENIKPVQQQVVAESKLQTEWETPVESKNHTHEQSISEWEVPTGISNSNSWQSSVEHEKVFCGAKIEPNNLSTLVSPDEKNITLGWNEPIQVEQTSNWDSPIDIGKRERSVSRDLRHSNHEKADFNSDICHDTSKHEELNLIPEPKAHTTTLESDDQKVLLQGFSPERDTKACLAIYNYPTFSPLDELFNCFSQSINELAFVTPTILYLRFKSHSLALQACQDYKVSGRQGFARVAIPPPYVNFISKGLA